MKKQIATAKNFVRRNQTKILITTTVAATGAAVLFRIGLNDHDKFLKEHDLFEKFYTLSDEE